MTAREIRNAALVFVLGGLLGVGCTLIFFALMVPALLLGASFRIAELCAVGEIGALALLIALIAHLCSKRGGA